MTYERKNIQAMDAYIPGEQIDTPGILKLNTNENPYPPSPAVARALAGCDVARLRQYPPPTARGLQEAIATLHGVKADNVIVTNGGDELLRMAIATFVEPTEKLAVVRPTYTLYQVLADAHGCTVAALELNADWTLPDNVGKQLNDTGARLAFIVNPHAPSGRLTPINEIAAIAGDFKGVLMLDEAYIDFVDPELAYDSASLLDSFDNVLILRTFSKGYSLAGLRMAYGIGAPALIRPLMKTKDSYNTDLVSQTLAMASIQDQAYARQTWDSVRKERRRVITALRAAGYTVPDSQSNFILAQVPAGKSADSIYQALKDRGILVRYFSKEDRLGDKLRITIGAPADNERLLAAMAEI